MRNLRSVDRQPPKRTGVCLDALGSCEGFPEPFHSSESADGKRPAGTCLVGFLSGHHGVSESCTFACINHGAPRGCADKYSRASTRIGSGIANKLDSDQRFGRKGFE